MGAAGPDIKLLYFPIPGRAEVARLAFTIGKVAFKDERVSPADFAALKPSTPFGQVPVLEVGGKKVAQSLAIDRYAARLAGLIPDEPLAAALADQAYAFVFLDIHNALIAPTNRIADPEAQLAARQALVAGPLKDKLASLTQLVEGRPGKFIAGDQLSLGDLAIFVLLSNLRSGWLKGIPTDLLDAYPSLKAFRNSVAVIPEVAAFYAAATDDVRKAGFTPEP